MVLRCRFLLPLALFCVLPVWAGDPVPAFRPGTRVLFQGDSITALGRGMTADPNHILGHSYVFLIAGKYGAMLPERNLVFINRAIGGNKLADMAARWQQDTLDLKPDLLSILIGINDVGHDVPFEQFEPMYDKILAASVAADPRLRIVLGEPFTLPVGKRKDDWEHWHAEVVKRQEVVAKLAVKYHAALVRYQQVFDEACRRAPAAYWIWDAVHPTYSGQQLMADEWVRTVNEFWPK
jgi:lysophospholipase L1-like esterase